MTSGYHHHILTLVLLIQASADQGVVGEAQVFRETPSSVQVRAGSDVFLKCSVDNQQGKAQWTKDGFALGFERSVPGYPRYQYAGDGLLGEHHLIIKGITLEDDGEYQCQVGPTDTTIPIWVAANVTVMVPPERMSMVEHEEGEVVKVTVGSTLQLQCEVDDARPQPIITWLKHGDRIDPKLQTDVVTSSQERRLLKVVSRLDLEVASQDDGEEVTCQATHPALQPPSRPLTSSITFSVLHPPGAPVIRGYHTGEVLRAGERRTLICHVQGGNPSPWVTWYWHHYSSNHTKAGKSVYLKGTASDSGREHRGHKKGRSRGVSVTQQLTATRAEDGAVYECRVSNDQLTKPLSTNVTLTVHYAPTQVKVTGPTVVSAGERFTLTCATSPANPPASLTWIIDDQQVKNTTTAVTKDDGGGWVTSSNLTYKAGRSSQVREVSVRCNARHQESVGVITHSRNITVLRPPGQPVVEVDRRGRAVAGGNLGVTCTSKGGHPPPTLKLFKGEQEMKSETVTRNGVSQARTTLKLAPKDNGAKVQCQAANPATTQPLTAYATLHIQFAAWEVTGEAIPHEVEAGQVVKVSCNTSPSIPASTITWRYFNPRDTAPLPQPHERTLTGTYGGTITRSEVRVRVSAEDEGRVLRCEADNGLGITVATNITLHVLHAPLWDKVPAGVINAAEGYNFTLYAKALANPGPIKYNWRLGGRDIMGDGDVSTSDGELHLSPITRLDSGNYTVNAQSPRGVIVSAFTLNVQYGPEKVVTPGRVRVARNGSTTVLCSAAGNPTPNLTWTRQHTHNTSKVRVLSTGVGEARLVVTKATPTDTGIYLCHASSSLAAAPPVTTTIVVEQAPWWSSKQPGEVVARSWAALGGTGQVECHIWAEPPPVFHWASKDGRSISSGGKYTISESQAVDGVVEWMSVLEVRSVTEDDYTHYTCTAINTQGKHTYTLALTHPVPPAPPTHLIVTNVTLSQVDLFWQPDLTRTKPEGYLLTYKRTSGGHDRVVNVTGSGHTRTVVGDLAAGTRYSFTLQAYNTQGISPPSSPQVTAITQGVAERVSSTSEGGEGGSRVPRLILLIMTLAGTALLALNMAIIACFVRRRTAHNNRGVSASSSKTTTLEVFSPVTTPGGAQGDDLPLTATTHVNTLTRQGLECQSGLEENEHTSLFRTSDHYNTSPTLNQDVPATNRSNSVRSHQNGGLHLQQKYRGDDTPYYYSPLPQAHHCLPGDDDGGGGLTKSGNPDGVMARPGNPPDVCPTTSTDNNRGTLTRKHQQNQNQQQQQQQQQPLSVVGGESSHVEFSTLHAHPTNFPTPHSGTSSSIKHNHRSQSEEKHHERNPSHHSHHSSYQQQQQPSRRSSLRKSEGQRSPNQQQHHHQQQLDHFNTFIQSHRDAVTPMSGGAGSYATLGSRRHHQHPPQQPSVHFSTLQRPSASSRIQAGPNHRGSHHRGQEPDGGTQEDSGSSGYGGSPRLEGGVPGLTVASHTSRPIVLPPPPSQVTTGTLGRHRSPHDHDPNKGSKGVGGSVIGVREGEHMDK
ncbi:hypothetical protein Pcinc_030984 [Petrolisthes cinctipes]|uniref:Nephrin n=1 Tax=Petrolisthes cinctipes TaxID=88211 RepID=A0AAE1EX98_PETCI|nr:hypothetical protein Pcinc_030984 [Petrolisthes cinctipes]